MLCCAPPCCSSSPARASSPFLPQSKRRHKRLFRPHPSRSRLSPVASLKVGVEEIAELAHNKVLISATLALAIGQLSKPFTSALNGDGIDFGAAIRAGGMPSSHSAGVMAATTCLGLERGFSDPIFGMSAVFAALVMYDAQGVRREVSNHAKILNKIMKHQECSTLVQGEDNLMDSVSTVTVKPKSLASLSSLSQKINSYMPVKNTVPTGGSGKASKTLSPSISRTAIDADDSSEIAKSIYNPVNESVGHTELQVIVGALLGFVVSLVIEVVV